MLFAVVLSILFITVALFVPKRLKRDELYAICLFSTVLGFSVDIVLDFKYHLYGYIKPGVQILGFLPSLCLFPASGVLFMNFFPFKTNFMYKVSYIIGWTIICLLVEYSLLTSGYFYYNGWKVGYSAFTYPFLFIIHLLHWRIYRRFTRASQAYPITYD